MTITTPEAPITARTDEPMSEALTQELAQWQELSRQSWETFPYEEASA